MGSSPRGHNLRDLADRIRHARRFTILTGAGVSAASGVPTFRGPEGLWRQFRPEDLATPEAFARDPQLVWEWYAWRRQLVARCEPNAAHHVIARWSHRGPPAGGPHDSPADHLRQGYGGPPPRHAKAEGGPHGSTIITQNVDDLHVRAGTRGLIRLHGSLWEFRCAGGCEGSWRDESVPLAEFPPHCRNCGDLARPAIVWFGEPLAPADVNAAFSACACDVFMTIGTSAVVHPAAGLVHRAKESGAFTAEINVEATPASAGVDVSILGAAECILPELERLLV
jgi:NAD-dependent deacetylase